MKQKQWGEIAVGFLLASNPLIDALSVVTKSWRPVHAGPTLSLVRKSMAADDMDFVDLSSMEDAFRLTVLGRYACTRFQRFDGNLTSTDATPANRSVVEQAIDCLDLARRAPSGFNAQPYKIVLVHSREKKAALARHCIGRNADRVRDSDCTAVFLADREVGRTMKQYKALVENHSPKWKERKWGMRKVQGLINMFSSGYPVPRMLAVPISFALRVGASIASVLVGRFCPLPTLSSAETWSSKNTMLVAMTYMLACSSRGLATSCMEGYNAGGIKNALGVPRRYSIPLIVSTGNAYRPRAQVTSTTEKEATDGVGMSHGSPRDGSKNATPRYPRNEVVYGDTFGNEVKLSS